MRKTKKKIRKENVCEKCYADLKINQLFCEKCGHPTRVLKEDLSAKRNWQKSWEDFKNRKGENYPFAIFFFFVLLLPHFALIYLLRGSYLLTNLALLFTLPLVFIPFAIPIVEEQSRITIGRYFKSLKFYPRMFLFVLVNIIYLFLLKVITTSVDPILNLVRLIMVLYWLSIIVPYPHLLIRKGVNPIRGLRMVYKAGSETRWQQFFTYVYLFLVNVLGLAALGVGLLVTIPYSIAVLERYYLQLDKQGLFINSAEPLKESLRSDF